MKESHEVLWRYFVATGQIGVYLLYKMVAAEDSGGNEAERLNQYS